MAEMIERPQAIIRIVPGGGARTAAQICNQWTYLSRKGEVQLQRSERHLGVSLQNGGIKALAESWAVQTGSYQPGQSEADSVQELTTHIVVSFPPETRLGAAFAAGRGWAEEMFGSGRNGGTFDYLTACHSDRPHPHVHLIVNRRALEGHWLKISRRHASLNYEKLRSALVEVACRHDIVLEATSRAERGLTERPITYAEYRRRARAGVAISNVDPWAVDGPSDRAP
jgi:type IV secretion system T-DNA border endonuclease VirD2